DVRADVVSRIPNRRSPADFNLWDRCRRPKGRRACPVRDGDPARRNLVIHPCFIDFGRRCGPQSRSNTQNSAVWYHGAMGPSRPERIPLFPLNVVLLPGTALPLHIFEPRYREMIGRCVKEKTEFGLLLSLPRGIVRVGCTAEVMDVVKR